MDPSAVDEFIERVRVLRQQEELDSAAVAVLDAFDGAGVRSLLLKGPALARLLYAEHEHRGYSDVDLLVAPTDLAEARRTLPGLGFEKSGSHFGIDDVAGIQYAEQWGQRGETGAVWIDLHWRLWGCEAPDHAVWDALSRRRTSIDLAGRETAVLERDALALHLALHAAQHGLNDRKAMGDFARGLERWGIEIWSSAATIAGETGATPTFAAALRLLPAGAALATELRLPDANAIEWEILHRRARPRGTFHLKAFAEARDMRARADVMRRSLFPTRQWITWEIPWARRGRLALVAAYMWHILRAPAWALRSWHYRRRVRRAGNP
jgi:Uncharacterised nucleotidyltransferase